MIEGKDNVGALIYKKFLRVLVKYCLVIFTGLSVFFLISFLCAAAVECFNAIRLYWVGRGSYVQGAYESAGVEALALSLKAVEYILVAPLPYLFVLAIGNYLLKIGDVSPDESTQKELEVAQNMVTGVKSFATALLASIVAVDLTGAVLKIEPLAFEKVLPQTGILLVLCVYLFILERRD